MNLNLSEEYSGQAKGVGGKLQAEQTPPAGHRQGWRESCLEGIGRWSCREGRRPITEGLANHVREFEPHPKGHRNHWRVVSKGVT